PSAEGAAPPDGERRRAVRVKAPQRLARRPAQVGIVEAADGARLQQRLAPGQRLVSRDGALWRWDGLVASADAPTAAAQRLAQKNRLSELMAEAGAARLAVESAESALAAAESLVGQRVGDEATAREQWRAAQRRQSDARDALQRAERAAGELAGRREALA